MLGPSAIVDVGHRRQRHAAPFAVGIFSAADRARSLARTSRSSCTRTGIRRSSIDTFASAASTSPMVATRITSAICCGGDAEAGRLSSRGADLHFGARQRAFRADVRPAAARRAASASSSADRLVQVGLVGRQELKADVALAAVVELEDADVGDVA